MWHTAVYIHGIDIRGIYCTMIAAIWRPLSEMIEYNRNSCIYTYYLRAIIQYKLQNYTCMSHSLDNSRA